MATDASIFLPTHTGSWAYAADVEGEHYENCGVLEGEVRSSTETELQAVYWSLIDMGKRKLFRDRRLDLYCDNECVVNWLNSRARVKDYSCQDFIDSIWEIVDTEELHIIIQHIPGHTKRRGLPYDLNRRADELCGPIARAEHEMRKECGVFFDHVRKKKPQPA